MDKIAQPAKITGQGSANCPVPKHSQHFEDASVSQTDSKRIVRTYKFRLFVNTNQERELSSTLETHRRLYNAVLDGKMLCWETAKASWSFFEQSAWFTVQRRTHPHYAKLNALSARQTLRNLDKAFDSFFRRCKSGKTPGHPRFKSKDRFSSFVFSSGNGYRIVEGKLRLQNIGTIRVRWHRALPSGGVIKQVAIKRQAGKWFACFAVEIPKPVAAAKLTSVGIDVGLKAFVTTSAGESLGDSRSLERAIPELCRRQRALSRCKRGSHRRQKVKHRVVVTHAKVANSRRDMHHKVSRSLVDRFGTIAAERLNVQGMLKNRRLSRRISDAGWYSFVQILTAKAESAGGRVILVDAQNTSQQCSACGATVPKSLSVRVHKCPCGCELDRDENAARNILARGLVGIQPEGLNAGAARRATRSRRNAV